MNEKPIKGEESKGKRSPKDNRRREIRGHQKV